VAHLVLTRDMRDMIRTELGKEVLFVMLKVDQGDVHTRIMKRHGGNEKAMEMLKGLQNRYESAGDEEEQVITLTVTKAMTPQEVIIKTLNMLEKK